MERVGSVLEQIGLGRVSFARAAVLAEATAHLDAPTAAVIAGRVLRPLTGPDGVPLAGVAPLSPATFRARLHRQLVLHHGLVGQAERTYDESVKARRMSVEPNRDGTGSLLVTGDGPRLVAAMERVDKIARWLREDGDPCTPDQIRADVATDLLLRGWIPTDPTFAALGRPPAATVNVTVSLASMLGIDAGVAQIRGWGCVSAQRARELALQAGSIWTRIVTDPLTGRAIEATADTYRVPARMAEQVKARDGTCRAPGCEIPAERCDLDHTREWTAISRMSDGAGGPTEGTGGPTAETNLAALHRGHHNLKTTGFWDSDQSPDGTVRWTTATGRTFTTYPFAYDHPDNLPINTSSLEARVGMQLARFINPDIPLAGHLSIFDQLDWAQTLAPATPARPQHQWPVKPREQPARPTDLGSLPPF